MSRNVIRDGMTRRGRIDPEEGLHDELNFEFRPMLAETVEATEYESEQLTKLGDPRGAVRRVAERTAEHIVSWSEVGDRDLPIPVNVDSVRRLPFVVLNRLYRIVAGMVPSDLPVDPATSELVEHMADVGQQLDGAHPAETEAEEGKNSEKG